MAELTLEQKRALALAQARVRSESAEAPSAATAAPAPSMGQMLADEAHKSFVQPIANLAAGAVRGAGSIGATLLAPIDVASDLMDGKGWTLESNRARRAAIDGGLRELGADTDSWMYQGGKLGGEIAGTAGVGGLLAKTAQAAHAAPALVNALRTFGASSGASTPARDIATRVLGGAVTGGTAAAMINPEDAALGAAVGGTLPLALTAAKGGVNAARHVIGSTTGVGDEALRVAYQSGKAGGAQGQALRENMRGQVNMLDVLDDARANLDAMRQTKNAAYRQNMAAVRGDKTVLDLAPIEQSIKNSIDNFTFKGQARNPQVLKALQDVSDEVSAWKQLDPAQFHTPEGLDALKQRIGAIRQNVPFEARDVRAALDGVYNSTKRQIEAQAPNYSTAMRDYSQASELIDEITRTLSLGDRKTADAAMRKLQAVMRNNVNTNYGTRTALLSELERQGGRQLAPQLAGQALNDWVPRGIQRATSPMLSGGALMTGNPLAAAGNLAISSPRLMGEAAYLSGASARTLDPLIEALRRGAYYGAPAVAAD
jgi:hypothetical protein